ncbi:hypothetical protein M3231_01595 [Neobacillus mesonae]|nr:hypothetical protein [Neobacillus mesonae]
MLKTKTNKNSILKWGIFLLLILLSWVLNLIYYHSLQLDKPLFPKQYMTSINYLSNINVYYLENKHEGKKVSSIYIKELPNAKIGKGRTIDEYDYQVLNRFYVDLVPEDIKTVNTKQDKDIVIREIEVYYDDGSSEIVPIGEIVVRPYPDSHYVSDMGSMGAYPDGSGHNYLRMTEDAFLTKVEMTHADEISSLIDITLYGKPYDQITYPKKLSPEDKITLRYHWKLPEVQNEFIIYDELSLFYFETPEGEDIVDFGFMSYNLYYSEKQIRHFVREGVN